MRQITEHAIQREQKRICQEQKAIAQSEAFADDYPMIWYYVRYALGDIGVDEDDFLHLMQFDLIPLLNLLQPHEHVEWFLLYEDFPESAYNNFWDMVANDHVAYYNFVQDTLNKFSLDTWEETEDIRFLIQEVVFLVYRCIRRYDIRRASEDNLIQLFPKNYRNPREQKQA